MQKKVGKYIESKQLLMPGDTVIVGISGGADSVALLHILKALGYKCIAAHCNFHLRGSESDRDETFVRQLTTELEIPGHYINFDTKKYAANNKLSIEMAARDLRYEWFEQLLVEHNAQAIAVAHHRDDSVETMLMNLVRGTGLKGLTGIPYRNEHVVRPLLCVSREEIMAYLMQYDLSCVEDSTNASTEFTRNKFRHEVLPLLETINPSVRETLYQNIERFEQLEGFYMYNINQLKEKITTQENNVFKINKKELLEQPYFQTFLFEMLYPYGFNASVVSNITDSLEKNPGLIFKSNDYQLLSDRDYLIITPINAAEDAVYEITEGLTAITEPLNIKISVFPVSSSFIVSKDKFRVHLDASKLKFPLTLRHWRQGDSFIPFGMQNKKKLSDFFIDEKISRFNKDECWLLLSGNEIVWVIGYRTDNRYRVSRETTKIVEFELKKHI
jgi:tRNA(Ile)-lysidine synthase